MFMAIRRKTIILVTVIVAAAITAAALLLTVLGNPDRYRPVVISYLEAKTGKRIEVGHIGVKWIPLSIRLDNFGTRNSKPFPSGYFLKAARMDAAIDAVALLHRQIAIKSIVLHDPIINVISDPDGLWNFENPPSKEPAPFFALGVVPRVEITGGQLFASNLIDPSDRPGPVVLEAHNLTATLEQVDFDAFIGPVSSVVAQGDMKADALRFGSIEATNVNCKLRLQARQVFFSDVRGEAYGGSATGDLSFDLWGKNPSFKADARIMKIDMDHLLAAFRNARGKMTGTMEGELKLAGEVKHSPHPLEGIRGAGHVTVRNGQVPSLKLNENLMKLAHFNDLGPAKQDPSSFSSISTDLSLANQRISSSDIDIVGYGVNAQGSGSLSVTGSDALDYQGVAEILAQQGFFTNTIARLAGATLKNGRLSFPFRVGGTIQNPSFSKGKKAD
jgi:AsmA-like C-terminal region/AsmA family